MDVMKPKLLWIEGICYRKNTAASSSSIFNENQTGGRHFVSGENIYPSKTVDYYEDEADCLQEQETDDVAGESDICKVKDNLYRLKIDISSNFFGCLIGARGATRMKMESETNTKITIPNYVPKGESGTVVIEGSNFSSVESAQTRIEIIISQKRHQMPFTHFVSIPFNHPILQEGLGRFKNDVFAHMDNSRGLDGNLFQNPAKLHLTICALVLADQKEREKAAAILNRLKGWSGGPLMVKVKGVEYMNDDPSEVDVLYAKVECADGSNKLQELADACANHFSRSCLMKEFDKGVKPKLHVTIMNSLFRTGDKGERTTFDAMPILKKFEGYNFGHVSLQTMHLSQMKSTSSDDGYYASSASVDI